MSEYITIYTQDLTKVFAVRYAFDVFKWEDFSNYFNLNSFWLIQNNMIAYVEFDKSKLIFNDNHAMKFDPFYDISETDFLTEGQKIIKGPRFDGDMSSLLGEDNV